MKLVSIAILLLTQSISVSGVFTTDKASAPSKTLENQYIITLKGDIQFHSNFSIYTTDENELSRHIKKVKDLFNVEKSAINKVGHVYGQVLKGYAATLSPGMLEKVKSMPEVKAVVEDGIAKALDIQDNAPWGLSRVSHRGHLTNENYQQYVYDPNAGNGVSVYVVDSGITITHNQIKGRAIWGANFASGQPNYDNNGHGSHCAGTVGSNAYGVAKSVQLIAVKVLGGDGSGSYSDIIAGINWAARDRRGPNGNILSMSLGGPTNQAINDAADNAVLQGVTVIVAAGNDNKDACDTSPANAQYVITVGATDINDNRASFSNFGRCVNIFGPGKDVLSIWNNGPDAYNTISGTSMATPHIAGLAAGILTYNKYNPTQVYQALINIATPNLVYDVKGSPNLIGYNGYN